MATTTLTQMRTRVRQYLGRPDTDTFYSDTLLTAFINEGIQSYSIEYEWPWLTTSTTFNTAAGTSTYSVPNDWMLTKVLVYSGADVLEWMPLEELLSITASGQPQMYKIELGQIMVRPIPDAVYTYTHYYYKTEPALSNDSDTPLLPEAFIPAITHYAASKVYIREGQPALANEEQAEYAKWLQKMARYCRRSDGSMRPRIRPGSQL